MPREPMMNCDMNVRLKPTNTKHEADLRLELVVHLARHLRPPVEQAAEEGHDGAAHHDVVEVGDDEVRVGQVDVDAERPEEEARQAADREEEDERHRVEHRRRPHDRPLVEGRRPVEHLHARRDGDEHRQRREEHRRELAHPGHEHVVAPHEEAEEREADGAHRDREVPEDGAPRERGDELAVDGHSRARS